MTIRKQISVSIATVLLLFIGAARAQVTITLSPPSACPVVSQQQQFQATVSGGDPTVTWSVDRVDGGYSAGGFISSSGLYTAPSNPATHYIKATSVASPTSSATAEVIVRSGPGVSMMPVTASVIVSGSQQFQARACGLSPADLTWAVDGIAGGNASVGTVDSTGLYSAPSNAGTHQVQATSLADSSKKASATIKIYSQITADFGSRANTDFPVAAGTFGVQLGFVFNNFYQNQSAMAQLSQAGLSPMRIDAQLQNIFPTNATTPNWNVIDPLISTLKADGFRPLVVMGYSPSWLQPNPNPCSSPNVQPYHAVPTDVNQWAQLAAAFVNHMDQTFPGFVQDYEIWNEPDNAPGLCVPGNSDSGRLSAYLSIYSAAAPVMRAQATNDGMPIRIGGPALTNSGTAPEWIPALLSNPSTAQYVDFVSYHHYPTSPLVQDAGMTWDNVGWPESLAFRTQDPGSGFTAIYKKIADLVKAGSQLDAAHTPIFLDEYNTTASFTADCCRNDPKVAPLWNALVIQDVLNSVYSGVARVPGGMMYFSAQNWFPGASGAYFFCLIGTINSAMDCAYSAASAQPYPQYYAYNLVLGANYLGLGGGGFMAPSSPAMSHAGLAVSAFYTATNDAVVITNPTASDYPNLPISLTNVGSVSQGTLYLLSNTNPNITTLPLSLTANGSGFTTTVSVPRYSVAAISINNGNSSGGVTVVVVPSSTSIAPSQSVQFTATVTGASDTSVTWSVDNVVGGNATVGTISTSGLYRSPATSGIHTVTATSVADGTKSASAQVTVVGATVLITISPSSASLTVSQTQQFTATVQNTSNTSVTWSVDGITGGSSSVGLIDNNGLYTAPPTVGNHTVTATSVADVSKSASAQVTVTPIPIVVTITPQSASVPLSGTQQFQATVQNATDTSVVWMVDGIAGGNSNTGQVNTSGLYTAPAAVGTHTVTATSVADASKSATAQVTVTANPDFGFSASPNTMTISAGQSAKYSVNVQPINGFNQAVSFTCTSLPAASTCAASMPTVSFDGSSAASTTITISTTARTVAAGIDPISGFLALMLAISSALSLNLFRSKWQSKTSLWSGSLALLLLMVCISCGGGGSSGPPPPPPTGTPAGTYKVTLVGTSGSISHSATVTLVVN